jgi:hypothetical protein
LNLLQYIKHFGICLYFFFDWKWCRKWRQGHRVLLHNICKPVNENDNFEYFILNLAPRKILRTPLTCFENHSLKLLIVSSYVLPLFQSCN